MSSGVFEVAVLYTLCLVTQVAKDIPDRPLQARIDDYLSAKNSWEAHLAGAKLFGRATPDELQNLMTNADSTISLRAAWEVALRSVKPDKTGRVVDIDPAALHRFVGFVEDRLSICMPQEWKAWFLCTAGDGGLYNFFLMVNEKSPYHKTNSLLLAPRGVSIDYTDDGLLIVIDGKSYEITNALLHTAGGFRQAVGLVA